MESRMNHFQPENKAELIACMKIGMCFSNKRMLRTHVRKNRLLVM